MNAHFVAFVVGLAAVALTAADVSHLKQSSFASNSLSNDDQQNYVSIKFNNAGNTQNTDSRYWWMNTETSPFRKTHNNQQNHQILSESYDTLHQTHNNLHETQQQHYNQNPFLNANSYAHMATLSGSPSEVNSLMQDTTQDIAQRYQPATSKVPCYGASQVCAPKQACENGFIAEANLGLVLSQSNVSFLRIKDSNINIVYIKTAHVVNYHH
jgi:hypothetical protein